ncbi:hypothetical protein BD324DRAFT_637203 [Kockovaella imperatae]|uniref:FAD-binding domain-containing protein n=1 Tax=Kockovaella imperatae TaxID=4999 RepID=A0A1Y1U880_9TREE|nr:hypothetical protein BD324DRAFT_637203 [Kockovaella imperatae]ORX34239.1 hypothetical protein BD324DRAFT_637203 [Kockovaella imperatae]
MSSSSVGIKVIIVGGGLGGTCLALALAQRGIKSEIYEGKAERQDIGGSLTLAPNCLRVLDQLGLWRDLRKQGTEFEIMNLITNDGFQIGKFHIGSRARYGYPALRIRRYRLHQCLVDAATQSYPELISIQMGKKAARVENHALNPKVHFADGTEVTGDYIVGADGIHSMVRQTICPDSPEPQYTGIVSIGAMISPGQVKAYPMPCIVYGRTGTIGLSPCGAQGEGEEAASWFATLEVEKEETRAGWAEMKSSGQALKLAKERFADWRGPIVDLIEQAHNNPDSTLLWAQYSVPELPRWHSDRVVLIGDAAHAIPPSGGQGAAQAFEDAWLLAEVLAKGLSLSKWEAERRKRLGVINKFTQQSGKSRQVGKASVAAFNVKKWMMWTYFKMSSIGRGDDLYSYDGSKIAL